MKKITLLLILISFAVLAFGQQAVTRNPGEKVTLADGTEHTVTLNNPYSNKGCIYVTVEVISCNAAGVQITVNKSTVTSSTWTNVNSNAAASKTVVQYCFLNTNPRQDLVTIRLKGTAADVIKFAY